MFLLGLLDESQLRERISDVPILRERELCQAEFYVGVAALQGGDVSGGVFGPGSKASPLIS